MYSKFRPHKGVRMILTPGPSMMSLPRLRASCPMASPSARARSGFHVAATAVLWAALVLTVFSAVDYFYRFFRKADYRAIVPGEDRWS